MSRRVYECLTYDTATATCTQAAFVERSDFPELSTAQALELSSHIAYVLAFAWCWKQLGRIVR
jgi:hypothetical protein